MKKPVRKPKKGAPSLSREENPRWLTTIPTGPKPAPPIRAKAHALPLLGMPWEDFERLCRKLAERDGAVEKAWCYGGPGQAQRGIDILVRMKDGAFEVWQSKRHKKFGNAQVKKAVDYFLEHEWAGQATRFVLALACPLNDDPNAVDALEEARTALKAKNITFEPLGCTELTERLRGEPEIIDDFFSRPWVDAVCGAEAAARLADRLSRFDVEALRVRLRDFYSAWIATVDPGLPIAGQDKDGRPIPAPALGQRYVLPDLLMNVGSVEQESEAPAPKAPPTRDDPRVQTMKFSGGMQEPVIRPQPPRSRERSITVDQFMASEKRSVITADAGAGKTTLLRFIALDILSDAPEIEAVRNRYGGYVPVWVPFALWARMAEGNDHPPPLGEVVHAFIAAQNDVALAADMKRVLTAGKIILLVDGLDEARGSAVPDTVLSGLTTFAEMNDVPVIATSRPHGMKALSGIGGNWTRLQLAPLSETKRDALALLWYRILERSDLGKSAAPSAVEAQAEHRAKSFAGALARNTGIARLSYTPLFLVALLKLHRTGRDLPRNRFDASKEIVDQLLEHQPRRRAKDAVETKAASLDARLRDRLLDDFAYGLHAGELRGSVADGAFEADAVARAANIIITRTGTANLELAEAQARTVFSFSEESAGLLVKKAPDSIGFLHRLLQEYLVARKLVQLPLADRIEFIRKHAAQPTWSEPILYLLYLVTNEQEAGQLLTAIEQAPAAGTADQVVRNAVLTEAVFADFAHDLPTVRRLAETLFAETERFSWGARERQLLAAVTDGLFSQSVSAQCSEKLKEWTPDFHGGARAGAVRGMRKWPENTRSACLPYLLRIVAGENEYVWRDAAQVLAEFADGDAGIKAALLDLLHRPRSVGTVHASLFALGRGWKGDADVAAIAEALRESDHIGIQTEAIRIRAERDEADLTDLEIFARIGFDRERDFSSHVFAPDVLNYFGNKYKAETLGHLERAFTSATRRNDKTPLVGSLIAVDPTHALIEPALKEILAQDYALDHFFTRSNIQTSRVVWTPEAIALVEGHLNKDHSLDFETYWISKALRLPFVKRALIASFKDKNSLAFWSARGLVEGWGKDDSEVSTVFHEALDGPADKIAYVASYLPDVIDDKNAIRAAILRSFASRPNRIEMLVTGIRRLGLPPDDEEVFRACYSAGSLTKETLSHDMWRGAMINTFPGRPEIRELALAELERRDGNIEEISFNFGSDADMRARVLKIIAPLPATARLALVDHIEGAAHSSESAFSILSRSRLDNDGAASGAAIMAWAETSVAKGILDSDKEAYLREELNAIGPQMDHRRAAAVIGLGMANKLESFAASKDYQGRASTIRLGHMPLLRNDDRYFRRMLPLWDRFAKALGDDAQVISRLELSAETCLSVLNPGVENAERLFDIMTAAIPTTRYVSKFDQIGLLARFRPSGDALRDLIMPIVLTHTRTYGRTNGDIWAAMMAVEIFAEQFSHDQALLRKVVDSFAANPDRSCAAAALAEVALRRHEPGIETLLTQQALGRDYDIASGFKVMAAARTGDKIVDALFWLLEDSHRDTMFWNCSYWAPSLLRRIERDPEVGAQLLDAVSRAPSTSAAISLLALAGGGSKGRVKHRAFFESEQEKVSAAIAPPVGFDVTTGSIRLASHVLQEMLT
ncbi:NACHT domain-containing protein [Bradyrhizobium sp. USDA 3315]